MWTLKLYRDDSTTPVDRWCSQCEKVAVGEPLVAQVEKRMDGKFSPADRRAVAEVMGEIVTEHG